MSALYLDAFVLVDGNGSCWFYVSRSLWLYPLPLWCCLLSAPRMYVFLPTSNLSPTSKY